MPGPRHLESAAKIWTRFCIDADTNTRHPSRWLCSRYGRLCGTLKDAQAPSFRDTVSEAKAVKAWGFR
jgi:hypothetical protein